MIMRARVALVSFLTMLSLVGIAPARAVAPGSGPVQLLECRIHRRMGYVEPYRSVTITFVNTGNAGVDEVRFKIQYAGHTATLVDRGTFSKDVAIAHTYPAFWNVPFAGAKPDACMVDSVRYAGASS
jgi:hypothetical protein